MNRLKSMKETLMGAAQGQMTHLEATDAKELGEVIDMIKDLEEAIYYHTITEAMEEKEKEPKYYSYPMPMYYESGSSSGSQGGNYARGGNGGSGRSSYDGMEMYNYMSPQYTEQPYLMPMRDMREGRSPMSRKMYMESKEMHKDKTTQIRELDRYLQELTADVVEMVEQASPEEQQLLEKKMKMLSEKISKLNV